MTEFPVTVYLMSGLCELVVFLCPFECFFKFIKKMLSSTFNHIKWILIRLAMSEIHTLEEHEDYSIYKNTEKTNSAMKPVFNMHRRKILYLS